jgi:hypothetical protein
MGTLIVGAGVIWAVWMMGKLFWELGRMGAKERVVDFYEVNGFPMLAIMDVEKRKLRHAMVMGTERGDRIPLGTDVWQGPTGLFIGGVLVARFTGGILEMIPGEVERALALQKERRDYKNGYLDL